MPHPAGKSPQGGLGTETKRNLKELGEDAQKYVEWEVSRDIKRDVFSDVKEDVSNDVTDNIPNGGAEDVSFMSADLEACLLTPAPYLGQINLVSRSIPRLRFFKWGESNSNSEARRPNAAISNLGKVDPNPTKRRHPQISKFQCGTRPHPTLGLYPPSTCTLEHFSTPVCRTWVLYSQKVHSLMVPCRVSTQNLCLSLMA